MKLIVGLGNPGEEYRITRHNAGFLFVDNLKEQYDFPAYKSKFQGALSEGEIEGRPILLLKPLTYMNVSGTAVAAAAQFYKIVPEDILVIHDDLDIPLGSLKVKLGGGSGGHNGLKSIEKSLGTNSFWRLRIGINRPPGEMDVTPYVLGRLSRPEIEVLRPLFDQINDHLSLLLEKQEGLFLTKIKGV